MSQDVIIIAVPAAAPSSLDAPASSGVWQRLLGDCLLVGGSTAVCHVLAAASSLLLRALLDPAQMGVWQGLKLALNYSSYANLGITKAAARELSVSLGKGDRGAAERGLDVAFTFSTLASLLYALALVIAGCWMLRGKTDTAWMWSVGLWAIAGLVVLNRYASFQVTMLRARIAFGTASQVALVEAGLTLACTGLATWLLGLPGLYIGTALVMLGSLAFLRRCEIPWPRWRWNGAEIVRLIGIGGPILITGAASALFRSMDRLLILAWLDEPEFQLGCYSLALMVGTQLFGLANMLAIPFTPHCSELFGRTGSRREAARLTARASELQIAAMGLLGGLTILLVPPVLGYLLPEYHRGLAAMRISVPGILLLGLTAPLGQYLVAVNRTGRGLIAVAAGAVVGIAGIYTAIRLQLGLDGIALATAVAYSVYWAGLSLVSIFPELTSREACRYVLVTVLGTTPSIILALCLC